MAQTCRNGGLGERERSGRPARDYVQKFLKTFTRNCRYGKRTACNTANVALACHHDAVVVLVERVNPINVCGVSRHEMNNQICGSRRAVRPLHAEFFNDIVRFANTSCIRDNDLESADIEAHLDKVARGARDICDNGNFSSRQGVEKAGFSGIRCSDQNNSKTFANDLGSRISRNVGAKCSGKRAHVFPDPLGYRTRNVILISKIEFGFNEGPRPQERRPPGTV